MLAIEVELLTGRYAATHYNDRRKAEWPPHPARFFSALVAALHDHDPVDRRERDALEWLEQQGAPQMDVTLPEPGTGRRSVLDVYVPVNDVSLVGDIGKGLRDARVVAEALESVPGATTKQLKAAAAAVAKEEKKLEQEVRRHMAAEVKPPASSLKKASALLPDRRTRQVRTLPVFIPDRPWFAFIWHVAPPPGIVEALARLSDRVTRLGHSSSLVRCHITDRPVAPTLVPRSDGREVLRTIGPGQLDRLETAFVRHRGVEGRVLPARPARYGPPRQSTSREETGGVFSSEWIVFARVGGARPLSSRGVDLARALRSAIIEQHGSRSLPPSLSGHGHDGGAAEEPHLAFVTLPDVGHGHADASVQGCAIVLPHGLDASDREALLRLVAGWERDRSLSDGRLELGGEGLPPVFVKRIEVPDKVALDPARWCRPSRRFLTATPIALDRNPGNLRSNRDGAANRAAKLAQESIADACVRVGYPRPACVEISAVSAVQGGQPARDFRPWPERPGRIRRVKVHADITFHEPVAGPVILGAGRFFGLGLCMPVPEGRN